MSSRTHTTTPNLFSLSWMITIHETHERDLTPATVDSFVATADDSFIGVAAAYGAKSALKHIALSTRSSVLVIQLASGTSCQRKEPTRHSIRLVQAKILCNKNLKKLAFDAERVSTALYFDHGLLVHRLIDIQSLATRPRWSVDALLHAFDKARVNRKGVLQAFNDQEKSTMEGQRAGLRAWATWRTKRPPHIGVARSINTDLLEPSVLLALATVIRNLDKLRALKPTKMKNDIGDAYTLNTEGELTLSLTRFSTRVRRSENQQLILSSQEATGETQNIDARLKEVKGRGLTVTLQTQQPQLGNHFNLHTYGKEDPTPAETERAVLVLELLQNAHGLFDLVLARALLIDGSSVNLIPFTSLRSGVFVAPPYCDVGRSLNKSQKFALRRILSPETKDFVCLIQGPPGTGKTTVIAAAVKNIMATAHITGRTIWLMAQSNVAMKTIAEKLASVDFWDFKILVSFEFHFDWHEHLYRRLDENVIRSDVFSDESLFEATRDLRDIKVILCTIAMLSSHGLMKSGIPAVVPLDTVIIDEASQIEIGEYIPLLAKFGRRIRKLVFFGDERQLSPYGQEQIGDLRSIFTIRRFRENLVFLTTQYRMPVPIGNFLSKEMYSNRLQSIHTIKDKTSCRLVDVSQGCEMQAGNSWKNVAEAEAVTRIAKYLCQQQKAFKVITPYDGQRGLLESMLKRDDLPWENKCFCVDSFQGNEEDYIIISIVRSKKIGFLSNYRRSNVMLSRCKKGMYIVTSRDYVRNKVSATLLGRLAKQWGPQGWTTVKAIVSGQ